MELELFTVRIYLVTQVRAAQAKSGLYPIKIEIVSKRENRKQKTINTGCYCSKQMYEAIWPKLNSVITPAMKKTASLPEAVEIKRKVEAEKNKYYDIIKGITASNNPNNINFLSQVLEIAKYKTAKEQLKPFNKNNLTIDDYVNLIFDLEWADVAKSTRTGRWSAFNMLYRDKDKAFKPDLKYNEIDKKFMQSWEAWLRDEEMQWDNKPKSWSTIRRYFKILKMLLEYIADDPTNAYTHSMIPIGSKKTQHPLPIVDENEKIYRYLNEEDFRKFKEYEPKNDREELAKDVWFMLYYCGGCNASDLVNLKRSDLNIKDEEVRFYRQKNLGKPTKTVSIVPTSSELLELFEKYKPINDRKHIVNFKENAKTLENATSNLRSLINDEKYLKQISKTLEMEHPLRSDMARHTYATNLTKVETPIRMISQILGHSSITTTENYLAKFKSKDVRKYLKKIL